MRRFRLVRGGGGGRGGPHHPPLAGKRSLPATPPPLPLLPPLSRRDGLVHVELQRYLYIHSLCSKMRPRRRRPASLTSRASGTARRRPSRSSPPRCSTSRRRSSCRSATPLRRRAAPLRRRAAPPSRSARIRSIRLSPCPPRASPPTGGTSGGSFARTPSRYARPAVGPCHTRGGPVPHPRRAVESCRNALTARGCPRPSARRAAHSQNCYAIRDAASVCAAAREEAGRRGGDVCADEMPPSEVRTKNKHTPLPVPRTHTARPTRRCALLRCGRCTRTSTTCR